MVVACATVVVFCLVVGTFVVIWAVVGFVVVSFGVVDWVFDDAAGDVAVVSFCVDD